MIKKTFVVVVLAIVVSACQPTPEQRAAQEKFLEDANRYCCR